MLKNGKLFGKVSIIDILVFLIIVVAAVAVYFRISATPQNVQVKTEKFSYLVRMAPDKVLDNIKNNSHGIRFFASSKTPVFRYHLSKISHRQRVILNGIHQIHVTDLFTTQIIG